MGKSPINIILNKKELRLFLDTLNQIYDANIFLTTNGITFNNVLWVKRFQGRANSRKTKDLRREKDLIKIYRIREELQIEKPRVNKVIL